MFFLPALLALLMQASAALAQPIVIAHRGASAERPEHTLEAYALAIDQGADFIEPDLVMTRDGVAVARHENEISGTTDVASRPEFASRRTTRVIDGETVTGWFTEDFTLAELKTLVARERVPALRPGNDARAPAARIPTFAEVVELARVRGVGVYPETKHSTYFRAIGLPIEPALLEVLASQGWGDARDKVFIQSFEVGNLKALRQVTRLPLVQLMAADGGPADQEDLRYAGMATPEGLAAIAGYADVIGVEKTMIRPRDPVGRLGPATGLVARAHAAGLKVHAWTFRPENYFLPAEFREGTRPDATGDLEAEISVFLKDGIDGIFSDSVPPARAAVKAQEPHR
jgi:glycerophosphoryl diester phosphodiesterase